MAQDRGPSGCEGCVVAVFILVVLGPLALVVWLLSKRWIPTILVGVLSWFILPACGVLWFLSG